MKVDFNFGATAEIALTPESSREESLVKMAFDTGNPLVTRMGDNKIRIQFYTNMNTACQNPIKFTELSGHISEVRS